MKRPAKHEFGGSQVWEYLTIPAPTEGVEDLDHLSGDERLDDLGEKGWDLVAILPYSPVVFIFKRPVVSVLFDPVRPKRR